MSNSRLVIGVDASNIRDRGGLTQLKNFIAESSPDRHSFSCMHIWSSDATLKELPSLPWLVKRSHTLMERGLISYLIWHLLVFKSFLSDSRVDVLYSPGGTYITSFRPCVSMSRNLLPFQFREALRYFPSLSFLRLLALHYLQKTSFNRSACLIFLSEYARLVVRSKCSNQVVVPHGISKHLQFQNRSFPPIQEFSYRRPFSIVYVSPASPYKHHSILILAVSMLRNIYKLSVSLKLIGLNKPCSNMLSRVIREVDPLSEWVSLTPSLPPDELSKHYNSADLGVFSSTCENLPNIVLEMMASALPIASSYYGPMPDLLPDGVFYDPLNINSILQALFPLIVDERKRRRLGMRNYLRSSLYDCSNSTDAIHFHLRSSVRI